MLVVLLKFSDNKSKASQLMEGHKEWIKRGFDDGVFLLVGNLQPNSGGGIVAHNTSRSDLQGRVNADPFVAMAAAAIASRSTAAEARAPESHHRKVSVAHAPP